MSMSNPVADAQAALHRARALLDAMNRPHDYDTLRNACVGVTHELETAQVALGSLGGDVVADRPGAARSGDPGTSQAAARAIRTRSGSQCHQVLECLAGTEDGYTDGELQRRLVMVDSSQRTRRNELCQAGYVRPATVPLETDGEQRVIVTRPSKLTGLACIVWEITPAGRIALNKLNSGQMVLALLDASEGTDNG